MIQNKSLSQGLCSHFRWNRELDPEQKEIALNAGQKRAQVCLRSPSFFLESPLGTGFNLSTTRGPLKEEPITIIRVAAVLIRVFCRVFKLLCCSSELKLGAGGEMWVCVPNETSGYSQRV